MVHWFGANLSAVLCIDPARTADLNFEIKFFPTNFDGFYVYFPGPGTSANYLSSMKSV